MHSHRRPFFASYFKVIMIFRRSLKRQKYNNAHVKEDGYSFDSKREHKRYCELRMLARAGDIEKLRVHQRFPLEVNGQHIAVYEADFSYYNVTRGPALHRTPQFVVEDVKSPATKTPLYELKKKLMKAVHNITVEEV